ncbi:hypothetical protein FQN49_000536 [Arthroderma sp. PD_2]|nr:hypothetical protein FQN49_000536 [Arthroderma sp. PD_2]
MVAIPRTTFDEMISKYRGYLALSFGTVKLSLEFPPISANGPDDKLHCRLTADDILANDEIFTNRMLDVFTALSILERETEPRFRPSGIKLFVLNPGQRGGREMDDVCPHRLNHNAWRLQLLYPENLPKLHCVKALEISDDYYFHDFSTGIHRLDERVIIDIASALPNLEIIDCYPILERYPIAYDHATTRHFTHPPEGPLRDTRHDFARAVTAALLKPPGQGLPASLKELKLWFWGLRQDWERAIDQSIELPDLTQPYLYDPLSSAIRSLSQRLIFLDLRLLADSTLFWPCAAEDAPPPFWPRLKTSIS